MLSRFQELLLMFGNSLDLPLDVDKHGACAIQIRKGLIVQLQTDPTEQNLLVGCKIIEVPPGKFRENVLKEALKANGLPDPRVGTFAYIPAINYLFLFQEYPFDILTTGERVASLLSPFIKTAESWKNAIESGQAAPPSEAKLSRPLGLRP